MSPKDLADLRLKILNSTMEFVRENIKKIPRPSDREIAEYAASKLEIPVDIVEYVRDGMDKDLKKELRL